MRKPITRNLVIIHLVLRGKTGRIRNSIASEIGNSDFLQPVKLSTVTLTDIHQIIPLRVHSPEFTIARNLVYIHLISREKRNGLQLSRCRGSTSKGTVEARRMELRGGVSR
jgi:hypothetical protein